MRFVFWFLVVVVAFSGCRASNQETDKSLEKSLTDSAAAEELEPEPELAPPLPTAEGEHFEAFDLLRNRPLAHRITADDGGRSFWIDAREPDFTRYILGNHGQQWIPFAEVDGGLVSGLRGREAQLTIPAEATLSAAVLEVRLFNPARGQNELTLSVNGTELPKQSLAEGWQTLVFDLGKAELRADNTVALSFSNLGRIDGRLSGGGVQWARIGPDRPLSPEQARPGVDEVALAAAQEVEAPTEEAVLEEEARDGFGPHQLLYAQDALRLNEENGLSWTLWLHEDGLLDMEIEAGEGCGVQVELTIEKGEGRVETVVTEERLLVEGRGERQETALGFELDVAQVARLDVARAGEEGCEEVVLHRLRLIRPGEVPGVPERLKPPKYVVFWIIDTLRADYLPIHFETDVQAPNLQRLAEEGVSFKRAYVQGTESRASHATLFTGLYPARHGVTGRGRVDPTLPILPNFFQEKGYRTALFASNGYVSHLLNLNRGWDHYQNNIHLETSLDARFMKRDGLRWIEAQGGEPFFLYLGTIDPHVTYRKHREVIELYEPADYSGRFRRFLSGEDLGRIKAGHLAVTERERERIINLYKNEITFNDLAFGELRAALEEKGIWEDTLVVVTSDHGEEFWEHGSVGHGHNVHQEMVHVPLLFHYPRGLPAGRVVHSGAEVVDVLPTVLALIGAETPEDRQGMNLLPKIFGEHGGYPAPALATQYGLHYGLQIMDWKIYLRGTRVRVYDRGVDPLELHDVGEKHPLASRMLADALGWFRMYRDQWEKERWGVPNNVSGEFVELIGR